MFKVKWQGYPLTRASWEPGDSCTNCHELVDEFRETRRSAKRICRQTKRFVAEPACGRIISACGETDEEHNSEPLTVTKAQHPSKRRKKAHGAVRRSIVPTEQMKVEATQHDPTCAQSISRVFRALEPGRYATAAQLRARYESRPDVDPLATLDITSEMADAEPTYEHVLEMLRYIDFPENQTRTNVKKTGSGPMEAMCVGAVGAWKSNSYGFGGGVGGGNGLIISGHTQGRPNFTRLLARFARREHPGFTFTSIQVNKNYESGMHCDKNNLGPSAIIGLGGYTAGKLWGLELGAVDIKRRWVEFDGNLPHCTLPFTGARRDSPAAPCVGCSSSPCTPAHRSVSVGQASAFRWCTSPTSATRIANMPTRAMPCVS
jgi:hypothetical protein